MAHPRSRGEHGGPGARAHRPHGSSPLTRGAPMRRRGWSWCARLIPAHAGSTTLPAGAAVTAGAHPRSRGEHTPCPAPRCLVWGSSPLTRGARVLGEAVKHLGRLIPAHAGSTGPPPAPAQRLPAHPRSRGEHNLRGQLAGHYRGSSPLTRGALARVVGGVESAGLIPAHAGSTTWLLHVTGGQPAHPRSRGEHTC